MALEHVQNYNGLKRNVQETATTTATKATSTQINKKEMLNTTCRKVYYTFSIVSIAKDEQI